jgi:hypothetical protein
VQFFAHRGFQSSRVHSIDVRAPTALGQTSGRSHDDCATVALKGLQRVAPRSLSDELRLLAGGRDVDR